MHDFVPANDNFHVDPNFIDAVQLTMEAEEKMQEIAMDHRRKLITLRRERLRRHG
ncbi:MAG: hypothetical protein J0H57_27785 [Rhodospirillales bacterium]|nr:hypothetical protein [Rhodospirillales bacterium]